MKYEYYITFLHNKGYGSSQIGRDRKIKTYKDIAGLKNYLEEENKVIGVTILDWKLLKQSNEPSDV